MIASIARRGGCNRSQLRSHHHEQSSGSKLNHFGLHSAAFGLIDLVLALTPGESTIIREKALAYKMTVLDDVLGPGKLGTRSGQSRVWRPCRCS